MQEVYRAAEELEPEIQLLCVLGSYGDTMSAEEVLDSLHMWNESSTILDQRDVENFNPKVPLEHLITLAGRTFVRSGCNATLDREVR